MTEGNGTAEHPDGGIIWGVGFSWDATTCTGVGACHDGNGGLLAGSGDNGGAVGVALVPGDTGGTGGNGGNTGRFSWAGDVGADGTGTDGGTDGHGGNAGLSLVTIYRGTNFSLPRRPQLFV